MFGTPSLVLLKSVLAVPRKLYKASIVHKTIQGYMFVLTTQDNVYLSIHTPLGKDALILNKFTGMEAMNELFAFEAEVYIPTLNNADNRDLDFSTIIQQTATIAIRWQDQIRYISGIVSKISQGPTVALNITPKNRVREQTYYYLTIRPKAWMMTLTSNCLIFQNQTTLDIIKAVLATHEIDILDRTGRAGKNQREYCVQYNESDFNFICRLMEVEGIYYYFAHQDGRHVMVLCDNAQPFEAGALKEPLPVAYSKDKVSPNMMLLSNLHISQQIVSSGYMTKDYDFEKPGTNLHATSLGQGDNRMLYTYPGDYRLQPDGQNISDRRLGAVEFPFASCRGDTNVSILEIGTLFTLTNCPRKEVNDKEYVLHRIYHEAMQEGSDQSEEVDRKPLYANTITFFDKAQIYLPSLKTLCPKIYGTQTAIVMGKDGEEIWTDQYGRVLVKFYWDLSDTTADKTSCWIRVAQQWTGKNWGVLFTPRIGQEVVVAFLNGNPDYPLITGCVYNGENLPPYLPDAPTKSTIKTNSSKGGAGFNEVRFEDKKDEEEIFMHAEKDLNVEVLNGHRTTTIMGEKEGGNDTLLLKKGNRSMTLDQGNESITLKKGNRSIDVTGDQGVKVSGNYTMDIGGNLTIKVKGAIAVEGGSTYKLKATGAAQVEAQSYALKTQTTVEAQAGAQMSLKSPKIQVKADAMFELKSAMVQISADGMVTIKGSMIMLG